MVTFGLWRALPRAAEECSLGSMMGVRGRVGGSVRPTDLEGALPSCSCEQLGVRLGVTVDLKLMGF